MSELRGELRILYEELNSPSKDEKKEALKKVIVYMSVGKDVSPIFQSVIKCIDIPDIEIKKLIYLYIINYSRSKPNDAIMIINQFVRVSFYYFFTQKMAKTNKIIYMTFFIKKYFYFIYIR